MKQLKSILVYVPPLLFLFCCSCMHGSKPPDGLLSELKVVIIDYENALKAKDLDAVMATLHVDSALWRNTTKYWDAIQEDNLSIILVSLSLMSCDGDVAIVKTVHYQKEKNREYENESLIVFKNTSDGWKMWSSVSLENANILKQGALCSPLIDL